MKRLWVILTILSVLLVPLVMAQITATATTFKRGPKEFTLRTPVAASTITNAYVAGKVDTFQVIEVTGIVLDSIKSGSTSAAIVDLTVASGNDIYTYRDTFRHSTQHIIPYKDMLGIRDSVFYFNMGANTISDGDIFILTIKELFRVKVDSLQNVY